MDTQPGQLFVPHDNDSAPSELQQPGTATLPSVQPSEQQSSGQPLPASSLASGFVSSPIPQNQSVPSEPQAAAPALPNANPVDALPTPDQDSGWQYNQDSKPDTSVEPLPEEVSWSASEFIEHPKNTSWYMALVLAALVLSGLDYFFTKDFISTGVILIAAIMFGVYAGHKPRAQQYQLNPQGLHVGDKLYGFKSFKAFSVAEEGATVSIIFMPLGRFVPALTIYVAPDMEDKVLDYLSAFLPLEQRRTDAVDGLLRRIRF